MRRLVDGAPVTDGAPSTERRIVAPPAAAPSAGAGGWASRLAGRYRPLERLLQALVGLCRGDEVVRRVGGFPVLQRCAASCSAPRVAFGAVGVVGVVGVVGAEPSGVPASSSRGHAGVTGAAPELPPNNWSSAASSVGSNAILSPNATSTFCSNRVAGLTGRLHVDRLHVQQPAADRQRQQVAVDAPRSTPGCSRFSSVETVGSELKLFCTWPGPGTVFCFGSASSVNLP